MKKEDILNYVKGYYRTFRQTKNGLFIYSGVYKKPTSWNKTGEVYTYISGEDIGVNYSKEDQDYLKEGLNYYIEEVKMFGGIENE
jgi:uncharacterized protein YacL (UPF0231 family)